jgi:hypothetical protein
MDLPRGTQASARVVYVSSEWCMNEYVHAIRARDPAVAWMLSGANGSRKRRIAFALTASPPGACRNAYRPKGNADGKPRRLSAAQPSRIEWIASVAVHVRWTWSPPIRESEPTAGRDRRCHAPPRIGLAEQLFARSRFGVRSLRGGPPLVAVVEPAKPRQCDDLGVTNGTSLWQADLRLGACRKRDHCVQRRSHCRSRGATISPVSTWPRATATKRAPRTRTKSWKIAGRPSAWPVAVVCSW